MSGRPVRVLELRSVRGTGGGPEKTILLGAAQADPSRFRVTVCYLRDVRDTVFGIDGRAAGLPVDYTEIRERHSFDPSIWPALRRLVRERGIDIVHAHDYKTDLLAWLLHRCDGTRVMATAHGWTGHSRRERWLYYPADRWVLARLPRIIAVSTDIREALIRAGARPDRVSVLLNGIDDQAFWRDRRREQDARETWGVGPDEWAIGSVGRLEPQKRFDMLIACFADLRQLHPRLRLLIAGDGSQRQTLERLVRRLGLADSCRLVGHVEDVSSFHHALNLFVQSSDYEGTPNAVLEAMALETPLVATSAGGTAELVTDGIHGLVVPPNRPALLGAAIERVLGDPAGARDRAGRARARITSDLSFAARSTALEACYDELMTASDWHEVAA